MVSYETVRRVSDVHLFNCLKMKLMHVFISLALVLFFGTATAQQGLLGEYFNGTNFETKVMSRVDAKINFEKARSLFRNIFKSNHSVFKVIDSYTNAIRKK